MTYKIITDEQTREFTDEEEFETMQALLDDQGVDYEAHQNGNRASRNGTPVAPDTEAETDAGGDTTEPQTVSAGPQEAEIVGSATTTEPPQTPTEADVPTEPSVEEDPVDWLPEHFIDHIQGVPTVNRKGYAVIASKYDVSATAEPIVRASESDFEYAEFRAVATTESGEEYSGFGSAHINRDTGDSPYLLNELAETRALKRAVSWATGVGLTAVEELQA